MTAKTILITLTLVGLIGSLIWLKTDPSWEPFVTTIGSIIALIALLKSGDDSKGNINMKQKGGKGSTNYQSGGDINIKK